MDVVAEVKRAIKYTENKEYAKAQLIYQDILKIDKNNSIVLSCLGLLYLNTKYFKHAERKLEQAEKIKPNLVTEEHAEVIDYIREMINLGVCEIAPGGGFHTEEWYGHLNDGGVASVIMPLWYMGRFTDYCADLDGKMAIYPIPVWNEGDVREVLQGGTGTSVIKGTENEQLAKDFLAFAKLSKEGCTYEWNELGFDPIRTELWDDPEITDNKDNKFLAYFTTNPFDVLKANGTDVTAPNISGAYSATYSTLVSTTYSNAFEISVDQDAMELLQGEQDSIIY